MILFSGLQLLLGLAVLVWAGGLFVSAAVRAADLLRLPRVVVGSTLVSLATTCPELTVAVTSGLAGEPGLAVGNAVGSCVCNVGLILGTMAVVSRVTVDARALRAPLAVMCLLAVALLVMTLDLRLSRGQGLLLLAGGAAYFVHDVRRHLRPRRRAEVAEARRIERDIVAGHRWLDSPGGTAVQFAAGAGLVALASRWLVAGAVTLADALAVPSMVVGLSVVAVGTSLPELATAMSSARRNVSDLAVGNILGANVANLGLVAGTAAAIQDVALTRATQLLNFPALVVALALAVAVCAGGRVSRRQGLLLVGFYGAYLATLAATTVAGWT